MDELPDSEGWICQSCGADNFVPTGFSREVNGPIAKVEQRVRYIHKDIPHKPPMEYTYKDDWFGPDADGAAADSWLMNKCIVWVEERVVYEPEPWRQL